MINTSKPVVRLETRSVAKKPHKKGVAEAKDQTIKLAIRLTEGINEALRALMRYRGDLSTMALEALDTVDLTRVALVSIEDRMVRDTTITDAPGTAQEGKEDRRRPGQLHEHPGKYRSGALAG